MNAIAVRWIEGIFAFSIGFWIIRNPDAVQRVVQSGAQALTQSTRAFWGGDPHPNG